MPLVKLLRTAIPALLIAFSAAAAAAKSEDGHPLAAMPLRPIGPALTSGRVSDFAFHPETFQVHNVAMASGGLWKTVNNGTR